MSNSHLLLLNKKRRAIRSRMARDAKQYAQASAMLLRALEKLSKDELSGFLKKNPDVLLDVAGGVIAHAGARAKNTAGNILREFKKDLAQARAKGVAKSKTIGGALESKSATYLKKLLSF